VPHEPLTPTDPDHERVFVREGQRSELATEDGGASGSATDDLETVISDAEADLLIASAVQRRDEQISGRTMGRQLRLVAGCGIAGLLLLFVGWQGYGLVVVAYIAGAFVLAVAGLLLIRALDLSPVTQWGEPVGAPCPTCGERNLREDRVTVPEANGIVALCTPDCGYADVRPVNDGPA
jgi:hypothetical protein